MLPDALYDSVSRETQDKLDVYHGLLLKWQKAINLVSPSTLSAAKQRHFLDSLQILPLISDDTKVLYDIGSGAGFPGLVVAVSRSDIDIHLIESDERKGQFLRTVSRETETPITVHTERIEQTDLPAPDVVTARALADLSLLFGFCEGWTLKNSALEMVFMKGRSFEAEIDAARAIYDFDVERQPSITGEGAVILKVTNLIKKTK